MEKDIIKRNPGCFSCKFSGRIYSIQCRTCCNVFGDMGKSSKYKYAGDRMMNLRSKQMLKGVIYEKKKHGRS